MKKISWSRCSFSTFISELYQTYLRVLSPNRPYQELLCDMWYVFSTQLAHGPFLRTLKQLQQLHSNNFTQQCTRRCTTNIYYKHRNNTGSKFQCCYLFGFVSFKCSFWKFELWRRYFWAAYSSPGGATLFVPILKWQSLAKMKGRYRAARAAKKRHQRCM